VQGGKGLNGYLFHLGKHGNAIIESYRVPSSLFAVEISCIQIRNHFLTYLTMVILLSPKRNYLVHSPKHTQCQSEVHSMEQLLSCHTLVLCGGKKV